MPDLLVSGRLVMRDFYLRLNIFPYPIRKWMENIYAFDLILL